MDALQAIKTRRSIRRFTQEKVGAEDLRQVLEAGMCAPSAMARRPFHFIVVREKSDLTAIMHMHPYARMLQEADICIAVCGYTHMEGEFLPLWPQDCAAALENMLIAAHAIGLGAVWMGVYPSEERMQTIGQFLGLPEDVALFGLVALGHPAVQKEPGAYYEPERIHEGKW